MRVAGVDLPDQAKLDYALTRVKGIGWPTSKKIIDASGVKIKRVKELTAEDIAKITSALESYATEGDLVRKIRENIQRLRDIGSYRGLRHARGLPVRGQRTRSNARTKRGKRKTVGAFRKDELASRTQPAEGAK